MALKITPLKGMFKKKMKSDEAPQDSTTYNACGIIMTEKLSMNRN